jgi:DNA-binding GntR family transcriptional regulator
MNDLVGQSGLGPVSRESTASIIARQLRNAIMQGILTPGTQLGETDLANRLKVSRGPLREAMQRLVQEGLLRSEHNRGLFVIELDADDVRDIYLARSAIERAAVATIIERDPTGTARRLEKAHRSMVTAARRGDLKALSDADLAFHQLLVEESGSPRLRRMHDTLLVETRMCIAALEQTCQVPEATVSEHGAMVEAIRDRDLERLDKLITAHTSDALSRLAPT